MEGLWKEENGGRGELVEKGRKGLKGLKGFKGLGVRDGKGWWDYVAELR
jgi:hypothetical protein